MAGDALRGMDDKYSAAIRSAIEPESIPDKGVGRTLAGGRQVIAEIAGMPLSATKSILNTEDPRYNPAMDKAVKGIGATARYAPVVGGVTAAGMGINELITALTPEQQTQGALLPN